MTRRVCETCRHFSSAGFDKMGWCNHPKRKTGTDVRVLVRSAELPCRNAWADDLWAEQDGDQGSAHASSGPDGQPSYIPDPQTEAFVARGAILADGQRDELAVDGPLLSRPGGDRSHVRRARQEIKERNRVTRYDNFPLFGGGEAGSLGTVGELGSFLEASDGGVLPAEAVISDLGTTERAAATARDVSIFDSVPTISGDIVLPRATNQPAAGATDELLADAPGFRPQRETNVPSIEVEETQAPTLRRPAVSRGERPMWPSEPSRRPERDQAATASGGARAESRSQVERDEVRRLRREQVAAEAEADVSSPDATGVGFVGDDIGEPTRDERSARDTRPASPRSLPQQEYGRDDAVESHDDRDAELLDEFDDYADNVAEEAFPARRVAAITPLYEGVPQSCSTCKDFRPAESGLRGWCNNTWAFGHPRMVNADELPCESLAGNWWVPSVDVVMEPLDVSAHATPTPLLDHWIAARKRAAGEEEETPLQRRKPS